MPGRLFLLLAPLALCLACSPSEPDPEAAAKLGPAQELPRELPPVSTQPRFVGMWAMAEAQCPEAPWTIRPTSLSTRGEVSCSFNTVTPTDAGYDIGATCHAQAPPQDYMIQFAFAESAKALLITGGPWSGQTGLVYCGPIADE